MLQLFCQTLYFYTKKRKLDTRFLCQTLGINNLEEMRENEQWTASLDQIDQWSLWLREQLKTPNLGLYIAYYSDLSQAGAIGHLLQTCKTIRESTEVALKWLEVNNPYFKVEVKEEHDWVTVEYLPDENFARQYPRLLDEVLEVFITSAYLNNNKLAGAEHIPVVRLTLTCAAPDDTAVFEKIFGITPIFNAKCNSLSCDKNLYDLPVISYTPELFALLNKHVEAQLEQAGEKESLSQVIKNDIMVAYQALRKISIDDVAEMHALSIRSVQRGLREEKTSFRRLQELVREELATTLLQDKKAAIKEVTYFLGYSNISAFSKAFKRWRGMTPSKFQIVHGR